MLEAHVIVVVVNLGNCETAVLSSALLQSLWKSGAGWSQTNFLTGMHCFKSAVDWSAQHCMKSNTPSGNWDIANYWSGMYYRLQWSMWTKIILTYSILFLKASCVIEGGGTWSECFSRSICEILSSDSMQIKLMLMRRGRGSIQSISLLICVSQGTSGMGFGVLTNGQRAVLSAVWYKTTQLREKMNGEHRSAM